LNHFCNSDLESHCKSAPPRTVDPFIPLLQLLFTWFHADVNAREEHIWNLSVLQRVHISRLEGFLHSLVQANNTLWARPCLDVAFFSLGTRQPAGLPQGAKRTQGFALRGFHPLGASTPGSCPAMVFSPRPLTSSAWFGTHGLAPPNPLTLPLGVGNP
jgi:hypothetical protein